MRYKEAMWRALLAAALVGCGALTLDTSAPVQAQASDDFWGEPVNLSHSGSAETPVAATAPDGAAQVLWWDRFDGLMTAIRPAPDAPWSAPQAVPLELREIVGEGEAAHVVTTPLAGMPQMISDGQGRVHAWWPGKTSETTGLRPLWYSRLRVGQTAWMTPEAVAEAALAWNMAVAADGSLHLVYLRPVNTSAFPAGLYYKRSTDGGATWTAPSLISASLYFRLLEPTAAHLAVQAVGDEVFVAWDDPRPARALLARSTDGGATWSAPAPLTEMEGARAPHLLPLAGVTAVYEAGQPCALYRQALEPAAPAVKLEGFAVCGQALQLFSLGAEGAVLVAGSGGSYLTLAVWNGEQVSEPQALGIGFEDPATGSRIALEALTVASTGAGQLLAAGQGQDGEIWALEAAVDLPAWAFAPPPVWSRPVAVTADLAVALASPPVAALDAAGRLHVLWSAANAEGSPGAALVYARKEGERWSAPVTVLRSPEGKSDHPALAAAGDRLHVVWSGGPDGRIFYSQAYVRDAATSGGWSEPLALSASAGADPQIAVDLLGRLHVIYAVPLNEGRGVYVTFSDDAGLTWSEPATVFDAQAAGWLSVAQPSLSVDEQGRLLAVWARAPLPGNGPAEGLYTAYAAGDGETWSEPQLFVEGAMASPRAVATLKGQTLVTWYDVQRGTTAYRVSADGGATWTMVSQVPGARALQAPPAVSADGAGGVHLAAVVGDAGALTLMQLLWDGERWTAEPTLALGREWQAAPGVALTASAVLGRLEVLLSAQAAGAGGSWRVLHTARTLPVVADAITPQFARATPTPTPGPEPTPTPTPRPQVNPDAPQSGAPMISAGPLSLPLSALGGVAFAALLVIGLVIVQTRRRGRMRA